jgi:aryl-alcohol dehydrogenase-like predicted oxidoreductase
MHRPLQLLGPNGDLLYLALQELKDTGKVQKVGISIYSPSELDRLFPQFQFDLVQAPFSLIDRRLNSTGWLKRLQEKGVEVHVRSAFLQGLLLMPQSAIPIQFAQWNYLWIKWHQWLEASNVSAAQACLAFLLSFAEIDRVVVGADNANQLSQLIDAANKSLKVELPDIQSTEENLINPVNWSKL